MRATLWVLLLLVAGSAAGANHSMFLAYRCDYVTNAVCFYPSTLTIKVGDSVEFYDDGDIEIDPLPHNVVADDGSFRCALGCDGEGGDGDPVAHRPNAPLWGFWRRFTSPGTVSLHDETSGATGTIIVQGAADPFGIGPGISGAWYDPDQSGQGLEIEVLPTNLFYATWFAYNPAGTQQAWFTGVGTWDGTTATISKVEVTKGGRWIPNFDPAQVVSSDWGRLDFTFTGCDHGTVTFTSDSGYGTGSMNLTHLARPAGLGCP